MRAAGAAIAAVFVSGLLLACGGTSLPEAPACVAPTPTRTPPNVFAAEITYIRAVEAGEQELADLLSGFRQRYPEGRFYRSTSFREDWVAMAGRSACVADDLEALEVPPESPDSRRARDTELEAILDEYRRVLDRGSDAVRQRNTSGYRDFNRAIDQVAGRLQEWVDIGLD